ncbi:MAG TPA: ABC transporter substrate-binding protein [Burkholderiales bacterium]|nr:ABC transporter substrate-binding protein [Burkholderiales bacterium]
MSRPVKLGLISEGTNTWPLYVAQARGLFERQGVDVEVTLTGSSVTQQEALIGGGFDIGFQQADHVVRAVERGSDLFIFMPHGHAPDLSLVAAPATSDIAQLRGRPIAVDGARTGYALLLRRLLTQSGLAEADIVFEEFGGSRERYDAMKSGAAAASLLNPPFDANLAADGYAILARMSEQFPTYPGSVMAARREWAREHAKEVIGFVRAYDAAYAWLQDPANSVQAVGALPAHLQIAPKVAAAALQSYATRARPEMSDEGLRQVIDIVWEAEGYTQPKRAPDRYMDLSYMQQALSA